jgi:beta-xylosidase
MLVFFFIITTLFFSLFIAAQNIIADNNPFMADPTIFFYKGTYYLYGTGGGNKDDGIKVFTSTDKKNWKDQGYVLKKGESYGTKGFWAPQIFEYNKRFYIAYTANEHIAIASGDNPLGPFTQKMLSPISSPVRMIDPFVFFDKGRIYLYHVRLDNGNRIFVAQLNKNLTTIDTTTLTECIHATEYWEDTQNVNWKVTEGPTILKHKKYYYLIYSANDFRNPDYAIGYAVSKSPTGPWKKYQDNPILSQKDVGINGTGHGDIFIDKNRKINYVFHTHYSNNKVAKRRTAIINFQFEKNKKETYKIIALKNTFHFLQTIN